MRNRDFIGEWLERALKETDPYNKFICSWFVLDFVCPYNIVNDGELLARWLIRKCRENNVSIYYYEIDTLRTSNHLTLRSVFEEIFKLRKSFVLTNQSLVDMETAKKMNQGACVLIKILSAINGKIP